MLQIELAISSRSQWTDTWPTSSNTDANMPGTWQGTHWSIFWTHGFDFHHHHHHYHRTERLNLIFLQSPHCTEHCLQHVRSSGQSPVMCKPCATHWALTMCNMCATWYKNSSANQFDKSLNHSHFGFTLLVETINWWRRGGNQRKPLAWPQKAGIDPNICGGRLLSWPLRRWDRLEGEWREGGRKPEYPKKTPDLTTESRNRSQHLWWTSPFLAIETMRQAGSEGGEWDGVRGIGGGGEGGWGGLKGEAMQAGEDNPDKRPVETLCPLPAHVSEFSLEPSESVRRRGYCWWVVTSTVSISHLVIWRSHLKGRHSYKQVQDMHVNKYTDITWWQPQVRHACDCLFVGCLTSQQHACVSQEQICSDNFTCCHTETGVANQTFYLTQSQNTDTGSTSPSTDPITPGAWQGSHWGANF